jgi:hypothetical protein
LAWPPPAVVDHSFLSCSILLLKHIEEYISQKLLKRIDIVTCQRRHRAERGHDVARLRQAHSPCSTCSAWAPCWTRRSSGAPLGVGCRLALEAIARCCCATCGARPGPRGGGGGLMGPYNTAGIWARDGCARAGGGGSRWPVGMR